MYLFYYSFDWFEVTLTTGFYFSRTDENTQIYDNNTYVNEYIYLGIVEEVRDEARIGGSEPLSGSRCLARIEQRNKFSVGDTIEIMKPDGTNRMTKVLAMYNGEMEPVGSCPHSKQVIWLELSQAPERYDLLRVENTR